MELDKKIQQSLNEWFKLEDEARPIKKRLEDNSNKNHHISDDEIVILLAPNEKFNEFYQLLRKKYPDLPADNG